MMTKEEKRAKWRASYYMYREQQRERKRIYYMEHKDEINAKRRAKRAKERGSKPCRPRSEPKQKWMRSNANGWEERYDAEELAKYGPDTEPDAETRSPEEMDVLREKIYRVLSAVPLR